MKHDPTGEFRQSFYRNRDPKEPTLFHFPAGGFHKALASAALYMPGAKKAEMIRVTKIKSLQINIYGVPQIFCAMARPPQQAPDVRTRAIFPEWCSAA